MTSGLSLWLGSRCQAIKNSKKQIFTIDLRSSVLPNDPIVRILWILNCAAIGRETARGIAILFFHREGPLKSNSKPPDGIALQRNCNMGVEKQVFRHCPHDSFIQGKDSVTNAQLTSRTNDCWLCDNFDYELEDE